MIQFSDKMIAKITADYEKAVVLFGECKDEVVEKINGLAGTEQLLAKYLYGVWLLPRSVWYTKAFGEDFKR